MIKGLQQQVSLYLNAKRWVVGFSGGVDSLVLLHALSQLKKTDADNSYPPLIALHINHQLQSDASAWQNQCCLLVKGMGLVFETLTVTVNPDANIEARARQARYQAFSEWLKEGDVLMLAHHQMDQAETFFYRLLRGSGITGLGAIPSKRAVGKAQLLRPLLKSSRSEITTYAELHGLIPIDDPSNRDVRFDRNYIRHQIIPSLLKRWPQVLGSIGNAIQHINEANVLLNDLAKQDLSQVAHGNDFEPWIDWQQMAALSLERKKNLLRFWFDRYQLTLETRHWDILFQEVLGAKVDARPEFKFSGWLLRRYKSRLYLCVPVNAEQANIEWHTSQPLTLKGYPALAVSHRLDMQLAVRFRRGGERVQISEGQHTRKLKTLLQELDIPYWRRDHIPLIYHEDQLIAIGDKLRCQHAETVLGKITIIGVE